MKDGTFRGTADGVFLTTLKQIFAKELVNVYVISIQRAPIRIVGNQVVGF